MKFRYAAAVAAIAWSAAASAQTLKPGLWEVTNDMKGAGMENAQAQIAQKMANMTPEQKKTMADAMAKYGMQMAQLTPGGGMSVKTCMTKEMIARTALPSQHGDCRTTKQEKNGNTMKFAVACTNPPATGEGQVTITSPETYTMKMVMQSKVEGKAQTMNMEGRGKWVSADCGGVKPPAAPAARK